MSALLTGIWINAQNCMSVSRVARVTQHHQADTAGLPPLPLPEGSDDERARTICLRGRNLGCVTRAVRGTGRLGFDRRSSLNLLDSACQSVGLDSSGAELLRLGANALYRLSSAPLTVRIGRSEVAAKKEVQVARWLAFHDFPSVRLAESLAQPLLLGDIAVTFWYFVDESPDPVTAHEVAQILQELHQLPDPTNFKLPEFHPSSKVEQRLDVLPEGIVTPDDIEFLKERHKQLVDDFRAVEFALPRGPIHGDAYISNLIRSADDSEVRLLDFEDFSYGPREWDVSILAIRHQMFNETNSREYADYAKTYGFDPIEWPGFPLRRAIPELNMTTWLMEKAGESSDVNSEIRRRVADLQNDQLPRRWRSF